MKFFKILFLGFIFLVIVFSQSVLALTIDYAPTITPSTVNTVSRDSIVFSVGSVVPSGGTLTFIFPYNTTIPSTMSNTDLILRDKNGTVPVTAVSCNPSTRTVVVTIGAVISNANNPCNIVFYTSAGIMNPTLVQSYTLQMYTSAETTPVTSPSYSTTSATTQVTSAAVTPSPSVENLNAQYTISFNVGGQGALLENTSTITITFPTGTTIPDGALTGVTLNSTPAGANGNSSARTVTITTPINIANNGSISIVLNTGCNIYNPSAGTKQLSVYTSVEATSVNSSNYTISSANQLSITAVNVNPSTINDVAEYTLEFIVGSSGSLTADSSIITVKFPSATGTPSSISVNDVTVSNGEMSTNAYSVTCYSANDSIRIVTPVYVPNGGSVTITFSASAGIVNPSTAGSYILSVHTSKEPPFIDSNPYSITEVTSTVTQANVIPNPATTSSASAYTINFNTGSQGQLTAGSSTITITFNSATTVATLSSITGATINGVSASGSSNGTSKTVTLTVPSSVNIPAGGLVSVYLPNSVVTANPTTAGQYDLSVKTSRETTNVASLSYTISNLAVTNVSVTINPTTVNTATACTVNFTITTANPTSMTIIFPFNTYIPASISTTNVTLRDKNSALTVTGVSTDPTTRTVVVTTSSSMGTGGNPYRIIFASAAGILNPTLAQSYTLTMYTTTDPAPVASSSYTTTATSTTVSTPSVTVLPAVEGIAGGYTVNFNVGSAGRLLAGTSTITITFPSGTTVPSSITAGYVSVNGVACTSVSTVPASRQVIITVPSSVTINNSSSVSVVISSSANIVNPSAGSYTLTVATSVESSAVTSSSYTISSASSLYVTSVTPSPSGVNKIAGYTIKFTLGSSGKLISATPDTIIITFPSNTVVPTTMAKSSVTVNGMNPIYDPICNSSSRTVRIAVPDTIDNGGNVTVVFSTAAGIMNPTIAGTNYTLTVKTSVETTAKTSPTYTITSATSSVTAAIVSPNPAVVNQLAQYTITFKTGNQGKLLAGTSTITITFPTGTVIGSAVSGTPSNTTVNGTACTSISVSGQAVTLTVPSSVNIGNNSDVSIVFANATNMITNPSTAGNYTLTVKTSVETTPMTSNIYPIGTATTTITTPTVTPSPTNANEPSQYTISFNVGASGALSANSNTITFIFPENTYIPVSITASNVTVNGTTLETNPTINTASRTITLTTPVNVANNGSVSVVFSSSAGIKNPSEPATTYKLLARTNVEVTNITSNSYTITSATTSVSFDTTAGERVTVNPNDVGTNAEYTIKFRTGANGRLLSGTSTITITFPSDTNVPSSITASTVKVNGISCTSVSVSGRAVTLTVPTTATVAGNSQATVYFSTGAGIFNPTTAGGYTLTVKTSVETTEVTSPTYTIGALAIILSSFEATYTNEKILIRWITANEINTLGFNLYRKADNEDKYYKITPNLILALANDYTGGEYSFVDTNIQANTTYHYKLEEVELSGVKLYYGPISVITSTTSVILTSFTAKCFGRIVNIQWELSSNDEVLGFNIYRGRDAFSNARLISHYSYTKLISRYNYIDREIETEGEYYYKIGVIDKKGVENLFGSVSVIVKFLPESFELYQNYPNPFSGETVIRYTVARDGGRRTGEESLVPHHSPLVTLKIYNITGQLIRTLIDEPQKPGYYTVQWNGRDNNNIEVSNGIYIYRLDVIDNRNNENVFTQTRRIILLK